MLRMLIVDDEHFVLDGLKTAVEWESMGIRVVGTATDGREALDFIGRHSIDILMTDIKMPIMDGFELIEETRTRGYNFKILVLTGYEDFDYAKKAIHHKVYEYLLKPIVLENLEAVIKRLVEECHLEKQKREHDLEIERQLKESLPILEERFYFNLLNGFFQKDLQRFLNLDISAELYKVAVIHLDNLNTTIFNGNPLDQREKQLLSLSIYQMICDDLRAIYKTSVIHHSTSDIAVILFLKNPDERQELVGVFQDLQQKVLERHGITVSIGIGRSRKDIMDCYQSFQEAREALKYKLYYGNNSILFYRDIRMDQGASMDHLAEMKQQLMDAINLKDYSIAERSLNKLEGKILSENRYTIDYLRNMSLEIVLIASLALYDKNEKLEEINPSYSDIYNYMQNQETIDDVFSALHDIYRNIIEYLDRQGEIKNRNTIKEMISYIEGNLAQEITLEEISKELFYTPNYLGYIFKEGMGVSFSEYVLHCRMEEAKRLLKEPGMKIYEVGEMVGYKNPHYFSKLFRGHTGMNPSEYRG